METLHILFGMENQTFLIPRLFILNFMSLDLVPVLMSYILVWDEVYSSVLDKN